MSLNKHTIRLVEADVLGGTGTLPVNAGRAASHKHLVGDRSRESGSARCLNRRYCCAV